MNPQDESNIVRFLIDLAQSGHIVHPEDQQRVEALISARQRPERPDPSPEDLGRQKRTPGASGKRGGTVSGRPRWPVRPWWAK